MENKIRITFGIIVLNGEPFTRYNLRALYPFAHQIIVVEGACRAAEQVSSPNGHSKDGTLETLRRFKQEEDPDRKITIVTAEEEGHPDGFWPGEKNEMSQAYAKRATGNWLWQVDVDEFYQPEDIAVVVGMLKANPCIRKVCFRVLTFWGGPDYVVDGVYLQRGGHNFHRLFAWDEGYRYTTHRPPTVVDKEGKDLCNIKAVSASELAGNGVFMYHYELLFPKQVQEKCSYYAKQSPELKQLNNWAKDCYFKLQHPYRVHMVYHYPSWLERYRGASPPAALQMMEAIKLGKHPGVELRQTEDVNKLLKSPLYISGRSFLKIVSILYSAYFHARVSLGRWKRCCFD
ncbi:MAG: hypothetical protein A2X34_01840 [Elusimicrobia bacterium GWC2_51_8]|nr:MAG: hypothetical protein A2X33_04190 [Elusimicrobia bacterium GWA2_51_34]OGR61721.1 MAG: hypothetical protein A2X34_01840 [Elusimicrobia bacterium GWC2_51_8]HAF96491.1 glycosyltransferase family 2 protein [Elusimicrobiota bacterium]HCE97570.1 glycosyltransferase family 2 protein [Elusimicrobiota bacterium]